MRKKDEYEIRQMDFTFFLGIGSFAWLNIKRYNLKPYFLIVGKRKEGTAFKNQG